MVVVHHTGRAPFPLGIGGGTTLDVGRSRLASLVVEDATGEEVPATQYSADLDAGTVQLAAPDTATHPEPWYALHRVEDMLLVGDVDLSGALTLKGNLSHDYPAGDTLVSAAMVAGDLQARVADFFDLSSWDRDWSKDDNDGADGTLAEYNATTYPPIITNRGAITEDWALIFTGSSTFRIVGRTVGEIGVGNINEDTSPTNPNQGVPYWTLKAGGFGAGWVNGNVIRFSTPEAEGELTDRNNAALVQINGVRDRLRVLLVSGEPHAGERAEREATFVRDTEAAIRAWSFDALDGLNGRTFHSRATAAESEFRVELELVSAGHDDSGVRVRAVVRDNRTSEEISRIVTFRGRT